MATDLRSSDLGQRPAIARSLRAARKRHSRGRTAGRKTAEMAKRSYGTGSLYRTGRPRAGELVWPLELVWRRKGQPPTWPQARAWWAEWLDSRAGGARAAPAHGRRGRRRGPWQRRTIAEAGAEYVDHLEHVMERKRTTIQDYRGYLRTHFAPFFAERPLDRIDERLVAAYLKRKRAKD